MDSLGQILRARNIISEEQLTQALIIQTNTHSRLGDIIISKGISSYLEIYSALAEHYNLEFVNLLRYPPDQTLLNTSDIQDYIRLRAIPWQHSNGKIIIAITEYSNETKEWATANFGENIELVITSPLDIRKTIEQIFGVFMEEESKLHLWQQNPKFSARVTISSSAKKFIYFLLFTTLILLTIFPMQISMAFITFCSVSYFFSMLIKLMIFTVGIRKNDSTEWSQLLAKIDDSSLPIYTILVPMYREVESLPKMLSAMELMDYPTEKMDIKLILEADDYKTIDAAINLKPSHNFEIIRVPAGTLRTKPKACNYALNFARGEYVTVFDADDIPDVLQLKKSVAAFRNHPKDVVCLQARLNYYNANSNWLTRFFSLEYSILFDVMLHGLERLNIPLPLGGTSNHISLANLHSLGQWDAYNVTEDADLGVRLAAQGFRTAMIDSCTMEEAPTEISEWVRQRSRWIKGYMQTWLVHMRSPLTLYRTLGARSFWGFQFFIGFSSFSFLTAPLLWLLALVWWLLPQEISQNWLPNWLIWLTLTNLFLNFVIHWIMIICCICLRSEPSAKDKIAALFYPFYLILHSIASYKALYQLIVKPHFWEKTTHGISGQLKKQSQN
ncbi:MAG: glycosyltransferase family 2 protein [Rickettsiales bacterium]|jgi:cellulose synthase/poly-beta-1,6-N-acetylglucosamine synthase-like glycosyltransferase